MDADGATEFLDTTFVFALHLAFIIA